MRVHVSDPAAVDDLAEFLRLRIEAVVERTAADEIEVSLLGSYSSRAMGEEIALAVEEWSSFRLPGGCRLESVGETPAA